MPSLSDRGCPVHSAGDPAETAKFGKIYQIHQIKKLELPNIAAY
jgi:hypothetical protein